MLETLWDPYEDTCNNIYDHPHQVHKKITMRFVLVFFQKIFFKPRNVSLGFDIVLYAF